VCSHVFLLSRFAADY